ncbi:transposase [Paenibacillus sp. MMS20-IR301]|uniref:transposase n=1 Tax=Paenibacillus sp. MMS20-IR301 TaxID=2895946 RepID=UPI0028E3F42F|nr:transposase [Paenibacillus sp. MMS20-IR301]WNS45010.1 transposase [Paenibacillus sp. MMS20-IR301]
MDAPRTDRCLGRCALQIFLIPLSGENPETKATATAFPQSARPLHCFSCEGCPLKERCTKAAGNREVVVSLERLLYQKQARDILRSEEGYALAVRRMTEPESVFGQLKNNRGFRRFLLRGMEKVTSQVGWLSLAHNLLKQAANDQKQRATFLQ